MGVKIVFKRWQNAAEIVKVTEGMEKLADKYLEVAASGKSEDKMQARKLWQQISEKYWDLLYALVDAQTESFPAALSFDEEERLFIDFGFLNDQITPRNKKFDTKQALNSKAVQGVFYYQTFTDFIAESWAMITSQPVPDPVCGVSPEARTADLEQQLQQLQDKRNEELRRILSRANNMSSAELDEAIGDMERYLLTATKVAMRVKEYREAKDEAKQAMSQDRFRYNEAERAMFVQLSIAQRDEEDPLGLPELEMFTALHESTKTMAKKIIYNSQDPEKTARRAKRIADACAQFSQQMMRRELKNMLIKKKEYMAVPAKVARCEQSLLSPQEPEPVLYADASRMLEEFCNSDMDMLAVPRIRMYGIPRVIFIPGQGLGTYDWADHTILLPEFPTTSVEKSLTYALATFRWDSDEDRLLKNTYEHIKDNKGKSILEMATSFYKDYFQWMTKEVKGYRVLPRETHKTFLQMFAPRKQED